MILILDSRIVKYFLWYYCDVVKFDVENVIDGFAVVRVGQWAGVSESLQERRGKARVPAEQTEAVQELDPTGAAPRTPRVAA